MNTTSSQAGKVALVTGGSRGIGAAIVRRLARDGAAVAFTYASSDESAAALVAAVAADGGRALAIRADSADAEAVRAAVARAVAVFGRLDILVNNAGILMLAPVADFALEDFDRMFAVNVRAAFVAVQAASAHMGQGGRVVTIGSIAADRSAFPTTSVYSMTKGALAAMVRGLAIDLAPRGITVNNVQPGPTRTDMNPDDSPHAPAIRQMLPVGRVGEPEEIAGMVAYLVGAEAGYVTGASFNIDGGYTI
jgi:3-oxoacyl-[acyl-carrier protein] reductase